MSHNITLYCGCIVYVACHPVTGAAHTRVLEFRHPMCPARNHEVGLRFALWELLPEPHSLATSTFVPANQHRLPPAAQGATAGSRRKAV
jgi:hypothetical protein